MTDSQINIVSRKRLNVRHFLVTPELLGLSQEFPLENSKVKIELPSADNLPKEITEESIMKSFDSDSILTISVHHKEENGRITPIGILVNTFDMIVDQNHTVTLPEQVLDRQPNQVDLLSKTQQKRLDNLRDFHDEVANRAFDRWLKILRWKSNNRLIGRPDIQSPESGGSTLLNRATRKRLWLSPIRSTMYVYDPITLSLWSEIEQTLNQGESSPVYIDSMFNGMEQFDLGNFQYSVVYLAVACEAFMRTRVVQNLPDNLSKTVIKYIDEVNISQVIDHLFKETLSDEQKNHLKTINSRLHELFIARNTIMHSGQKEDLKSADCKRFIEVSKKLIEI